MTLGNDGFDQHTRMVGVGHWTLQMRRSYSKTLHNPKIIAKKLVKSLSHPET